MTRFGKLVTLAGSLLLVSMLVLQGCGDQAAIIGPGDGGDGGVLWVHDSGVDPFGSIDDKGVVTKAAVNVLAADLEEKVVGVGGGLLHLTLGTGPSALFVPPAAVNRNVVIRALGVQVHTPSGVATFYDFSPDGLKFNLPAQLTLTTGDPNGKVRTLYWYNPASGKWEVQAQQASKNGQVTFKVYHFSKYGIS